MLSKTGSIRQTLTAQPHLTINTEEKHRSKQIPQVKQPSTTATQKSWN